MNNELICLDYEYDQQSFFSMAIMQECFSTSWAVRHMKGNQFPIVSRNNLKLSQLHIILNDTDLCEDTDLFTGFLLSFFFSFCSNVFQN